MRITAALAASLTLHLAAAMLDFQDEPQGQFPFSSTDGYRQEILATLAPPTGINSQLFTSSDIEAGSNDPLPETDNAAAIASGQLASTSTGTRTSSSPPPARYLERNEVDRPPRIIDNLDAKDGPLEKALAEFDVDGSIVIECMISVRGSVDKLNVVATTLPDTAVQVIVEQAKLARFIPARLNHVAVPSRILIELTIQEKPKTPLTQPPLSPQS